LKGLVEILPRYITAIYNRCLREGIFPKRWKKALIIPIIEPGKEENDEVSKFRPKSLLDIGGKVNMYLHMEIHTYILMYLHTNIHTYIGIYIHAHAPCTLTSAINPWNEVYRIAAGRRKQAATTNTLRQKDGKLATNLHGTLLHMLKNLTPDDNQADDNELHKQTRAITQEVIDTADDKEFTV